MVRSTAHVRGTCPRQNVTIAGESTAAGPPARVPRDHCPAAAVADPRQDPRSFLRPNPSLRGSTSPHISIPRPRARPHPVQPRNRSSHSRRPISPGDVDHPTPDFRASRTSGRQPAGRGRGGGRGGVRGGHPLPGQLRPRPVTGFAHPRTRRVVGKGCRTPAWTCTGGALQPRHPP